MARTKVIGTRCATSTVFCTFQLPRRPASLRKSHPAPMDFNISSYLEATSSLKAGVECRARRNLSVAPLATSQSASLLKNPPSKSRFENRRRRNFTALGVNKKKQLFTQRITHSHLHKRAHKTTVAKSFSYNNNKQR